MDFSFIPARPSLPQKPATAGTFSEYKPIATATSWEDMLPSPKRKVPNTESDYGPGVKRLKASDAEFPQLRELENSLPQVPFVEKGAALEERNGEIEVVVVNNDGSRESTILLTGLKCLYQKQLPEMPGTYVARVVYDPYHTSIAIIKKPLEVLAGITYRAFEDRKFAEITFCAVYSQHQKGGYGSHLMNHLKDYIRTTSPITHLFAYADNTAMYWFGKQGFTSKITLHKSIWLNVIKHYEMSTLMECTMLPDIRYLSVARMLHVQKQAVLAKIEAANNKNKIVYQPPTEWATGPITPINPMSIPAIRNSGWTPFMDEQSRLPRRGPQYNTMKEFLTKLRKNSSAGPFLHPVKKEEVPDYYDIIENPMDLQTMEEKLDQNVYGKPEEFMADVKLIISNARKYNDGPCVKAAANFSRHRIRLVKEIPEWSYLVD